MTKLVWILTWLVLLTWLQFEHLVGQELIQVAVANFDIASAYKKIKAHIAICEGFFHVHLLRLFNLHQPEFVVVTVAFIIQYNRLAVLSNPVFGLVKGDLVFLLHFILQEYIIIMVFWSSSFYQWLIGLITHLDLSISLYCPVLSFPGTKWLCSSPFISLNLRRSSSPFSVSCFDRYNCPRLNSDGPWSALRFIEER